MNLSNNKSIFTTMIDQVKKAIRQIEKLPREKQLEIAQLIQDELSWEETFNQTQDKLSNLAQEAIQDHQSIHHNRFTPCELD